MAPPRKHCLLVVDDEPDVCDSVHDLLRREFHVLKAGSAAEGCRLMEAHTVHIVMSDQRMPSMTGVEMLTRVRKGHPRVVRMLFTGFADLDAVVAAINQGYVFEFLRKPWRPEELEAAVRAAAAEYDALAAQTEEHDRLQAEAGHLRHQVAALEDEIRRLQHP